DIARVVLDLGAEKRFAGNHQRQPRHLRQDLARFAGRPRAQYALGGGDHVGDVGVEACTLKGGLDQTALSQPEVALAGQEAIAEHRRVEAQREVLDEVAAMGDENLLDGLRSADEIDASRPEAEGNDVAPVTGAALEEVESIFAKLRQMAAEQAPARARRQRGGHNGSSNEAKGAAPPRVLTCRLLSRPVL